MGEIKSPFGSAHSRRIRSARRWRSWSRLYSGAPPRSPGPWRVGHVLPPHCDADGLGQVARQRPTLPLGISQTLAALAVGCRGQLGEKLRWLLPIVPHGPTHHSGVAPLPVSTSTCSATTSKPSELSPVKLALIPSSSASSVCLCA